MGAPYFKWKTFLSRHNAVVVSSNYSLYGDMSARVMSTLGRFTPDMDIYSIDEAWLDLTHFNPASLDAYGRDIVLTVRQWTGIPVSIGIASTRVLAKIANRIAKKRKIPGGVFNLGGAEHLEDVLETIAVEDIWGIGRRWGRRLRSIGIQSAQELRAADLEMIRKHFGVVMQRIVFELRGINCIEAEAFAPKQQIMCSRSFGQRVTSLEHLRQSVTMHVSRAAEKLRSQNSVCGLAQVFIRTGLFNPQEPTYSQHAIVQFPVPTADTRSIASGALKALNSIYREGFRYAKAGVILMDLSSSEGVQSDLFHPADSKRSRVLMQTVDSINQRMGQRSVFFGGEGTQRVWLMKRGMTTKAYTTRWPELLLVR